VLLAGGHTWSDLQDYGFTDPPAPFDYLGFLDSLVAHNHNFFRLWRWEQATWQTESRARYYFEPQPYLRAGPGLALDGKPKFDLTRFNQAYFSRMRARIIEAGRRGLYVSVMLFNGWSVAPLGAALANPWRGHPYNRANNINEVNGDPDGTARGSEAHTLRIPAVVALEERFVSKVIETVGDLDNVLYEIANESGRASAEWQYHMIRFIRADEARRPKQHPVGMTEMNDDATLWASPADWVSPTARPGDYYLTQPPQADGRKVVLWDTDHLCGLCGDRSIVWVAFTGGANPVFMDPFDSTAGEMDVKLGHSFDPQAHWWVEMRRNLGYALAYSERINLARARPAPSLATTGYCLADTGRDASYLVYLPHRGSATVDLTATPGRVKIEWLSPKTGRVVMGGSAAGGAARTFTSPFLRDAVLYLHAVPESRR